MKFRCTNCYYEKDIPVEAEARFVDKYVNCPRCKQKSRVEPDSAIIHASPPPIPATAKRGNLPLYIGVGSGLFVLALVVLIAIVLPRSPQSSSGSGKFTKTVNIDDATTISVEYDRDRIYIPLNTDYHDCVPYENLWIDVEITRSGNRVEPTAGLFNMDGKPVEVTCKSSNPSICGCISGGGRAVALRPKSPGKCSISVEFMGKEVKCDFEFMQVPLRVFDDDHEPQKTVELIKLIGFPDEKKRVFAEEPGEKVDGFPHQLTGVYEHWRYKKYPGLIIATSSDMVIGIMTE